VFHGVRRETRRGTRAPARAAALQRGLAGRARAAIISPERVVACPAALLVMVLPPAADVAARDAGSSIQSWSAVGGTRPWLARRGWRQSLWQSPGGKGAICEQARRRTWQAAGCLAFFGSIAEWNIHLDGEQHLRETDFVAARERLCCGDFIASGWKRNCTLFCSFVARSVFAVPCSRSHSDDPHASRLVQQISPPPPCSLVFYVPLPCIEHLSTSSDTCSKITNLEHLGRT
jgi:hypothetical protein